MLGNKEQAMSKKNWFQTLNEALEAENLLEAWDISFAPIYQDQTFSWTWDNGSKRGHYISVYRDSAGRYERPVHYAR